MADKKCPFCSSGGLCSYKGVCLFKYSIGEDMATGEKTHECMKKENEPYEEYKFEPEPGEDIDF
jgi:hypothetical protein